MKTPDKVAGILDPYINRFELWNNTGAEYNTGDTVPAVGMAASYSIQLPAPVESRAIFLQVQDGRITNVMAHDPLGGRSVFDPRGRFLGTGGKELEPIQLVAPKPPVDIVTAVQQMNQRPPPQPTPEQVHEPTMPPQDLPGESPKTIAELIRELKELTDQPSQSEATLHRFHLRPDFEVAVQLPNDLTEREAKRLAKFIKSLPYGDDEESRF